MVINRRLAHLAIGDGVEGVYCHDWWLALVASHFGKVVFDDVPCLEYRRTGSNASPTGANAVRLLAFRIRTFLAQGEFGRINQQNSTFLSRYYHLLDPSQRRVLSAFTHGPTLLKTTYPRRLRQKMHEELALRLLLLLGY